MPDNLSLIRVLAVLKTTKEIPRFISIKMSELAHLTLLELVWSGHFISIQAGQIGTAARDLFLLG